VIEVSGGVVSGGGSITVQFAAAGESSVFPAASRARAEKLWSPTARSLYPWGEEQADQSPPSRLHSKLEPPSLESKEKLAEVSVVSPSGPLEIEVSGGVVSGGGVTVQLWEAGVGSVLPAASRARTEKLWEATESPL
jgi:hypothetical protein